MLTKFPTKMSWSSRVYYRNARMFQHPKCIFYHIIKTKYIILKPFRKLERVGNSFKEWVNVCVSPLILHNILPQNLAA